MMHFAGRGIAMVGPKYSEFSAGDSLLGYIYQVEYALYQLLDSDAAPEEVSIETIDDVVVGPIADPQAVLQLKLHSVNGDGKLRSLTDRHPDLWKTLRVWARSIEKGLINPAKTSFLFLTTSPLGTGCEVGTYLGPKGSDARDPTEAFKKLGELASDIVSDSALDPKGDLVKGASAFSGLPPSQQRDLVRNIQILTDTPPIQKLRLQIDRRLRARGVPKENHPLFVEMIIGWWYGRAIEQIRDKSGKTIPFEALETKISDAAKSLAIGSLHAYQDLVDPTEDDLAKLHDRIFVKQLEELGVGKGTIQARSAIVDFYKADGHIKRWIKDFKLDQAELSHFTEDLKGIWANNFGDAELEAPACAGLADPNTALKKLGRAVLGQTINAPAPMLKGFEGNYIARGTFHVMANRPEIGWHPYWETIFKGNTK